MYQLEPYVPLSELEYFKKRLEQVTQERDAAVADIQTAFISPDESCLLCKWYQGCAGEDCPHYLCGKGLTDTKGQFHADVVWTCEDFDWGTCDKLKDTPCNGCNFRNNWQWRGVV